MGYTIKSNMVRVDFFKEGGKWYTTEEMEWDRYFSEDAYGIELIYDTFKRCLDQSFPDRYKNMIAVCLEPYHELSHPLMVKRNKAE